MGQDIRGKQLTIKKLLQSIEHLNAHNGDSSAFEEESDTNAVADEDDDSELEPAPSPTKASKSSPAKTPTSNVVASSPLAGGRRSAAVGQQQAAKVLKMGARSAASLEALAKEMNMLEEKKKLVESLARK